LDEIVSLQLRHGLIQHRTGDEHPTSIFTWIDDVIRTAAGATHYGYVLDGEAHLTCRSGVFRLQRGMYFAVPGEASIQGGLGLLASRLHYTGLFALGGPIEESGRLCYIDGCSDSVLIGPAVLGDPCLNMLYIPAGIDQTAHTHPTVRVGIIAAGEGVCETPHGTVSLAAGRMFILPPDTIHSFHTRDSFLRIVVYHPDSDQGPTHDDHPMLNRTYVDGTSAAKIPAVRTRSLAPATKQ
jgi:quercetin dioxygenase-like cupin family protein